MRFRADVGACRLMGAWALIATLLLFKVTPAVAGAPAGCIGSTATALATNAAMCFRPTLSPYGYALCDGYMAYEGIDAQWCAAGGGEFHGYFDPRGACTGAIDTHASESATVGLADKFESMFHGASSTADTGWDLGTHGGTYCWKGDPVYKGGFLISDTRERDYVSGEGVPLVILFKRDRDLDCHPSAGYQIGTAADGAPICRASNDQSCPIGNPIQPGSGRKTQVEEDLIFEGMPIRRHYKNFGNLEPDFGQPITQATYWAEEFDYKLVLDPNKVVLGGVTYPGGAMQMFDASGAAMVNAQAGAVRMAKSGSDYFLYQQDRLIRFDAKGRVTAVVMADGKTLSLVRSDGTTGSGGATATDSGATPVAVPAGRVLAINSWTGRSLRYARRKSGEASSVRMDPIGTTVSYEYGNVELVNKVTYPDGNGRLYHYQQAGAWVASLAGYSRFTSSGTTVRAGTYGYDANGIANSTEAAGGTNRYWFTIGQAIYGTPLGAVITANHAWFAGVLRPTSISQPAGAGCDGTTRVFNYDSLGNPEYQLDFDAHLTCRAFDSRFLESARIEGLTIDPACSSVTPVGSVLPAGARRTSTQWHPYWRFETARAEPKKKTFYVYNGQPDPTNGGATASCAPAGALLPDGKPIAVLCKTVEQATNDANGSQGFSAAAVGVARVNSATYNDHGQVLTRTDPRGFVTSYEYYAATAADSMLGDLKKITNPAGHVTQYTRYDKAGRVLTMIEPNGLTTQTAYDTRGWVTTQTVTPTAGTAQVTRFTYTDTGRPSTVTMPNATVVRYSYDDAQRLVGITDGAGNTVSYTLDDAGNRVGEQQKDPSGVLARNISRVYDIIGRLQLSVGAPR